MSVEEKEDQVKQQEEKVTQLNEQYHKFKSLLERRGFSVARRKNASTTYDVITNVSSSTKFRRRQETKNVLEFIHRGKEGSIYGAWDDISSAADNQTMDKLVCLEIRVPNIAISDKQVENFERSLDIGHVHQIPNAPGVSRTIPELFS